MEQLIEGYRRYRAGRWRELRELNQQLAKGQNPRLMIIACCDSRVDPATIFDAYPGELFIIRNIANLVPPFEEGGGYHGTSAAIEFAVEQLRVETVLVMGHGSCGGVQAAIKRDHVHVGSFLDKWVSLLEPAKDRLKTSPKEAAAALEYESIRVSLENLMTFPFVAERVTKGTLTLAGAHYAIADGRLHMLDPKTGAFNPLD